MNRTYIEVPGAGMHELPPLLVRSVPEDASREELFHRAAEMIESEDMIESASPDDMDQRKLDLALNLTDEYLRVLLHWAWGDSVLEWIRQCEITFDATSALRHLLSPDVWPHAARSSFVELLVDKRVPTHGVAIDRAVGMRLTFRQPPPIDCCSDQFLFFLNSRLAGTAYETWARLSPDSTAHLPPNRFHFEVHDLRPQ
ncbi:MAG TPA: hypothetical protein VK789_27510 [Bryobacteraceae bacterium]|jgi:hypothetical protein|nr:hypothetical protein [Bryobacteraceae bacterium]